MKLSTLKKKKKFKNHLFLPFPFIFSATKDPSNKKNHFFPFISQKPNKVLEREREIRARKMKVPENVMLLQPNARIESQIAISPIMDRVGYKNRVKELLIKREKYSANMGLTHLCLGNQENSAVFVNGNAAVRNSVVVCEECNRREVGFHWCVYDAVTFGFKSLAGLIS